MHIIIIKNNNKNNNIHPEIKYITVFMLLSKILLRVFYC